MSVLGYQNAYQAAINDAVQRMASGLGGSLPDTWKDRGLTQEQGARDYATAMLGSFLGDSSLQNKGSYFFPDGFGWGSASDREQRSGDYLKSFGVDTAALSPWQGYGYAAQRENIRATNPGWYESIVRNEQSGSQQAPSWTPERIGGLGGLGGFTPGAVPQQASPATYQPPQAPASPAAPQGQQSATFDPTGILQNMQNQQNAFLSSWGNQNGQGGNGTSAQWNGGMGSDPVYRPNQPAQPRNGWGGPWGASNPFSPTKG